MRPTREMYKKEIATLEAKIATLEIDKATYALRVVQLKNQKAKLVNFYEKEIAQLRGE